MVDPGPLSAAVVEALEAIPGITVFDGYVPTALPETGGFPDPYVVLWAGVGGNPEEPLANGAYDADSLIWDFQTTVVGAGPAICRSVAVQVKSRLTNLRIRTGRVKPNPDGFHQQTPVIDTQTSPTRFMLALQWRLTTN